MTTTLPTAEQVSERLKVTTEEMANAASVPMGLWNRHSNTCLEASDLITAQAADIERLMKEREEIIRVYERQLDDQRIELQTEIEGWQTERNVARGDQEAAEASLAAVKAERDAMREALIGARAAIKAFHGPLMWEIYEHHAPEMKAIDAALSLDAQGEK